MVGILVVSAVSRCQAVPTKPQAISSGAMVATAHPFATNAASDILQRGGNAAEAADMAENGGHVGAQDLGAYRVLDGRYITTGHRGCDIHALAAPASGASCEPR